MVVSLWWELSVYWMDQQRPSSVLVLVLVVLNGVRALTLSPALCRRSAAPLLVLSLSLLGPDSFSKYTSSVFWVPDTILGVRDFSLNKSSQNPVLVDLTT